MHNTQDLSLSRTMAEDGYNPKVLGREPTGPGKLTRSVTSGSLGVYENQVFTEPIAGFRKKVKKKKKEDTNAGSTSPSGKPKKSKKKHHNGSKNMNASVASMNASVASMNASVASMSLLDASTASISYVEKKARDEENGNKNKASSSSKKEKHKPSKKKEGEVDESKTKNDDSPVKKERPQLEKTSTRLYLKKKFEESKPSFEDKKKIMRQPANVYQAAPKFTKDFKPPKFPKTDEEKVLIKKALRKNFVFANLTSKELRPLISAFEPCSFDASETIIKQGDRGDYFYIIQHGRVIFQVDGVDVGNAGKGSSFGELALLYTCPRAATVVAAKSTTVFRVGQATFEFILQNQTAESEKEKVDLLMGVNFLKGLNERQLKKMTRVMTPRIFAQDDLLVKKGDPGDAFYVIQEGEVLVKDISVGQTTFEDLELGPGGHFGERALVTSEPRAANVVAKTRGVAFSIDRETFEKVLGGMESLIIKAEDARLLAGIALFHQACLPEDVFVQLAELVTEHVYPKQQIIMKQGQKVAAAVYIVREGKVVIERDGGEPQSLSPGEFFGTNIMVTGARSDLPRVDAPYTVTATTDCKLAVLTLADCRYVFDTDMLFGKRKVPRRFTLSAEALKELPDTPQKTCIKLESLQKKMILGAGSFGQVWLVSGVDKNTGETKPYALKIQSKHDLVNEGQVGSAIREKQILSDICHPFIIDLLSTYQDEAFVYFLTEFVQGGELFTIIHKETGSGMRERDAKFYALCLVDALEHLHSLKIVYRDIKPENVLIDTKGYPKLIDFGFAKYCPEKTFTFCGTPGYVSPEIITKRGHNCTADSWSLGVLIYETLSGDNPFYFEGMDQITLFRSIVEEDYLPLTGVSKCAGSLVAGLLVKDPSMRIGSSKTQGFIMEHPWFSGLDVIALRRRELIAPWKPEVKDSYDAAYFDDWSDLEDKSKESFHPISAEEEKRFREEF